MPVLRSIAQRFAEEQPLGGVRVAACLHLTAETGVLARALQQGGAEVHLAAANPLSTQDDVVEALANGDVAVSSERGESVETWSTSVSWSGPSRRSRSTTAPTW